MPDPARGWRLSQPPPRGTASVLPGTAAATSSQYRAKKVARFQNDAQKLGLKSLGTTAAAAADVVVVEKASVRVEEVVKNDVRAHNAITKCSIPTTVLKALECLEQPSEVADEIRVASELLSGHITEEAPAASEVAYEVRAASHLLLHHAAKKDSRIISYDPSGASQSLAGDSTLMPMPNNLGKLSEKNFPQKSDGECKRIIGARLSSTTAGGGGNIAVGSSSHSAPSLSNGTKLGKEVAAKQVSQQRRKQETAGLESTIENYRKLAKEFTGVRYRKGGGFASEIRVGAISIWLATFKTPEAAARAPDAATFLRATYFGGGKDTKYNHKDSPSGFPPREELRDPNLSLHARDELFKEYAKAAAAGKFVFAHQSHQSIGTIQLPAAQQHENCLPESGSTSERLVTVPAVDTVAQDESQQEGSAESMTYLYQSPKSVDLANMF